MKTDLTPATETVSSTVQGDIFIVDDEPNNLRVLSTLLESCGYRVRQAIDGNTALKAVQLQSPDLILLDILMPGLGGYEVCQQLKQNPATAPIPVIFLSALNQTQDKVKGFTVGGADYISKPFQVEEVLARINHQLTIRSLQQQLQRKNQELEAQNCCLQAEIVERERAEAQLLQSEKLSSLGRLIAGVAHEINNPLGAIQASARNASTSFTEALGQFYALFPRLNPQQQTDFFALLERSPQGKLERSPKERRALKRGITRQLEERGLESARYIADICVDLGIEDEIDSFSSLIDSPEVKPIFALAYNLTGIPSSLQNILAAADRAAKIVQALKSYAHFGHSDQKQLVPLNAGIETVLELYHNQIKRGIEVARNYERSPLLWCYPDKLVQVWTNLIQNAIQAMDGEGMLEIELFEENHQALVRISDSGCGIPPAIQEKIFEPFFTTKPIGIGSGLGLDIVRQLVEQHQGRIEVKSQPGRTTFSVFLPLPCSPGEEEAEYTERG